MGAGDVWVAVGWSSDIIPYSKRASNISVYAPESGTSLWADLWVRLKISGYNYFEKFKILLCTHVALFEIPS
jgi:hypothetical protein